MDNNIVDCTNSIVETGECVCKSGDSLSVLKDVQRAYEEQMEVIERVGGSNKLQMQARVLRSWVGDLVAQNALLAQAVEDLEMETMARVAHERRRHAERDDNQDRSRIVELRVTIDTLQKENLAKDREIRKLTKELQQYELTLLKLRDEISEAKYGAADVAKKDAEVMAGMCCIGTECGDLAPVKDVGELLREETSKYRERIQKMELSLKSSGSKVRAVHKINLGLIEELSSLRRLCVAVDLERRDARLQLDMEGQIVKQMVKQLRHVKAKQPCDLRTSTPEGSLEMQCNDTELIIMPTQPPTLINVSDTALALNETQDACDCSGPVNLDDLDGIGPRAPIRKTNVSLPQRPKVAEQSSIISKTASQSPRNNSPENSSFSLKKAIKKNVKIQSPQMSHETLCCDYDLGQVSEVCDTSCARDQNPEMEDRSEEANGQCFEPNLEFFDAIPREPVGKNIIPLPQQPSVEQSSTLSKTASTQSPRNSPENSSYSLEKVIKKNAQIQSPQMAHKTECCDFSQSSSEACDTSCAMVQSPEMVDRSEEVNEQCFEDGSEVECLCKNFECLHLDDETRRNLKDKAVNVRLHMKKDSGGGSSCAGVCEQYYRNKLMATLQILQNKEETIRVQGSSLGVAEARIAALTERACALRCELDAKARELTKLRKFAESCRVEKNDISITADIQEAENEKNIVHTLQDNLSIITELYRECFYETAKQEELIDLLRKSYLDVRLMEKDKSDKINRLQNVVNTQKWSIEQCQDVVVEVESLKSEISNFLNNSNNDSGMWERGSETPDVGEELGDILDQLRQLQDILNSDCVCGLEDENKALKAKNEDLEKQLTKMRHKVDELENVASSKDLLDKEIAKKELEFKEIRQKLLEVESFNKEKSINCDTLSRQLQQAQVLVSDKSAELERCKQERAAIEAANRQMQKELDKADHVIKEGMKKLAESSKCQDLLEESRSQVAALERQLRRVGARCRDLEDCCRERQAELEEAHARGAALCEESRRVTACVGSWMRRQRTLAREQQEKIKMQESMLAELQRCVGARQTHSPDEPCCSTYEKRSGASETASFQRYPSHSAVTFHQPTDRSGTYTCGPVPRSVRRESEMASCSKCTSNRERSSESETASCSSAPVPPARRKRLPSYGNMRCPCALVSPTDQIIQRVETLHEALAAGQRRWARARR